MKRQHGAEARAARTLSAKSMYRLYTDRRKASRLGCEGSATTKNLSAARWRLISTKTNAKCAVQVWVCRQCSLKVSVSSNSMPPPRCVGDSFPAIACILSHQVSAAANDPTIRTCETLTLQERESCGVGRLAGSAAPGCSPSGD